MSEPIFILGCPRSGTTLISKILSSTENGEPFESHFITKYYKKIYKYGDIKNKNNFNRLLQDLLNERPIMQWQLNIELENFYKEIINFSYKEIVDKICLKISEKRGYIAWGDKTPHYILDLDIIYNLFPNSKFVYIVRDGRDVAISLLEMEWGPHNIYSCASYWKKYNKQSPIIEKLLNQGQLYQMKYECLLENTEKIARELYQFLNQTYNEEKMKAIISNIKKDNYNKWKKKMKQRHIRLFENVASDTLRKFGYGTAFEEKRINPILAFIFKTHDTILRWKFLIKTNTIDALRIKYFGMPPFAN